MPAADRFFENMRTQPVHLLTQPKMHLGHQVPVTLVPHIAAVSEAAGHSHTVGLDGVFAQRFGVERRKLAMPVNDLVIASGLRVGDSPTGLARDEACRSFGMTKLLP